MFPIDWQSPAVKDLLMAAAAEDRPAPPATGGRQEGGSTRTALRRRLGAALVRAGRRLEGARPPVGAGQARGPAAAPGAGA